MGREESRFLVPKLGNESSELKEEEEEDSSIDNSVQRDPFDCVCNKRTTRKL
jgi:hypothetical protein